MKDKLGLKPGNGRFRGKKRESEVFLCSQKQQMDESGAAKSICVVAAWQSICIPWPDGDGRTRDLSVWDKTRPKCDYSRSESQYDSQMLRWFAVKLG